MSVATVVSSDRGSSLPLRESGSWEANVGRVLVAARHRSAVLADWSRPLRQARQSSMRIGPFRSDGARVRVLVAHLAVIAAALIILALQGPWTTSSGEISTALLIALGLSGLRLVTVLKKLTASTLVLDAVGTVVLVAGTGAPTSPFYGMALAGVWWAANLPRRNGGLTYAVAFFASYVILVGPEAWRERVLGGGFEDVTVVFFLAILSDWFLRVDRRATPLTGQPLTTRVDLRRVLGILDMPVDVVLAAAQLGLTIVQAELLAYLVMGLTNREIADATHVGTATVRHRLTSLYRAIGVHHRRDAVRRAIALALSLPSSPIPTK
jgi:DNA-binding CsgD family transcriptional regulator